MNHFGCATGNGFYCGVGCHFLKKIIKNHIFLSKQMDPMMENKLVMSDTTDSIVIKDPTRFGQLSALWKVAIDKTLSILSRTVVTKDDVER
jgi:hypothetical protein